MLYRDRADGADDHGWDGVKLICSSDLRAASDATSGKLGRTRRELECVRCAADHDLPQLLQLKLSRGIEKTPTGRRGPANEEPRGQRSTLRLLTSDPSGLD